MNNGLSVWRNRGVLDSLFQPSFPLSAWADFSDFANSAAVAFAPRADISETNDAFHVRIELAGVPKDQIKVELDRNLLTISGQKSARELREGETSVFVESSYGEFRRSFRLPDSVAKEKIEAIHQDGVLTVTVPKSAEAQPRLISVA